MAIVGVALTTLLVVSRQVVFGFSGYSKMRRILGFELPGFLRGITTD